MSDKMMFLSDKKLSEGLTAKRIRIDGNILYYDNVKYKIILGTSHGIMINKIRNIKEEGG
jgi:hypothetical protein